MRRRSRAEDAKILFVWGHSEHSVKDGVPWIT